MRYLAVRLEIEGRVEPIDLMEEEDQLGILAALKKTLETGVPFQPEFRVRWLSKGVKVMWVDPEPARVVLTRVRVICQKMQMVVTNKIANAMDAAAEEGDVARHQAYVPSRH